MNGEAVNKTIFCFENECASRTFDRDIESIRLFLSEVFYPGELKYDRSVNTYYLEGAKRKLLEPIEYLLLEQILKDSAILRKDEFDILSMHLLDNTERMRGLDKERKKICQNYNSPLHNKALLKMHGDLIHIIREHQCIRIRYSKSDGEVVHRKVIPCEVKCDLGYLYLIGYRTELEDEYPAYYRMDRIISFEILNRQHVSEEKRVRKYLEQFSGGITQMYGGDYVEVRLKCNNEFYSYIFDKFRDAEIITQDDHEIVLKIRVFEDGFVKWIVSQPTDMITVVYPESTVEKIRQAGKDIMMKYGGMK